MLGKRSIMDHKIHPATGSLKRRKLSGALMNFLIDSSNRGSMVKNPADDKFNQYQNIFLSGKFHKNPFSTVSTGSKQPLKHSIFGTTKAFETMNGGYNSSALHQ